MEVQDAKPTVTEPSAGTAFDPSNQHTWSPEQREHWNQTGNVPDPPKKAEAESAAAPAKEAESEPKGKTAGESEAPPTQEKKGGKKSAEDRIQELIAEREEERKERKALEERLKALEAPKSEPKAKEEPKKRELLKRPNLLSWKGTAEEFDTAMDAYESQQRELAIEAYRAQQLQEQASQEMKSRVADVDKRYPGAADAIKERISEISSSHKEIPNAVTAIMNESEVLPDVLYAIGDSAKFAEFLKLAKTNPAKAIREFVVLEHLTREELKKAAKGDEKPEAKAKADDESPAPPKPRAPKPPTEVGGRAAAGEDAALVAAQAGDFRSFEAEERRKKFSRQ